jgi:RHS repeat-associated protein
VQTDFWNNPIDGNITHARVFSEPLIPVGPTSPEDNKNFAQALHAFICRSSNEDYSAFTDFLDQHPESPWRASLLTQLGIVYRRTGWFSKALACWEQAWQLAKDQTDFKPKSVADVAVAQLLELNARIGRYDRLQALFSEIQGRELNPAVTERVRGAREGLWLMLNQPDKAFRCGPLALSRISSSQASPDSLGLIFNSRSTQQGICLSSVCDLANEIGMNYQMAHRDPGARFILPAVVHWKVGHYAALLQRAGDHYLVDDPTFGEAIWVSQAALDYETSGYFVLPKGQLPAGWRPVASEEGKGVWGKGNTWTSDPSRYRPYDKKPCDQSGAPMAQYSFHLMLASLNIVDTPVGYAPPRGPAIRFKLTYNQRESAQPANFTYSNLGYNWTFDWLSYITDDPTNSNDAATCYLKGGGYETYTNFSSGTSSYAPQIDSHALLVRISSNSYERDLPDGSKEIFALPDGSVVNPRKIFLTQLIDPIGNKLTLSYNTNNGEFQLTAVTDALGQVSTLSYGLTNDTLKITQVTDPFGRHATFQYNSSGYLTNITDVLGITSGFAYASNFVTSLTTPYGTTTFTSGLDPQNIRDSWLQATDPLGQTERVEYVDNGYGTNIAGFDVPDSDPVSPAGLGLYNGHLSYRNSFYWDKLAMSLYPHDYAKARISHWLHSPDMTSCSGVEESSKEPLEGRVWRTYPGQQANSTFIQGTNDLPSAVARVLDDGSSQVYQYQYNNLGKPTQVTDPTNRVTLYTYATNLVDLIQVAQKVGSSTQILAQVAYSTNHLPLSSIDAAGQTNYFAYNNYGEITFITNALHQVTSLMYDTNGYLTNITGALPGAVTSFTYDGYGRVRTVTDSAGYTITTDYDSADRPTKVTFPDGTCAQTVYNRLDPILFKDRRGHWSTTLYDDLRRVSDTIDALGRRTHFDWCGCGSLSAITDPLGRVTTWVRDMEGRVSAKVYPDSTQTTYNYETNSSRLNSLTDAKGQVTRYQYFIDNNLKQVSYSNSIISTPSVSFSYDTNYNRLLSMTDGTGSTTYTYYAITNGQLGAGKLAAITNPIGNTTVVYYYDSLGRTTNRTINGVAQTVRFDASGRTVTITNALGTFSNLFVGATSRVATNFYPNGQQTVFNYYGNTNDDRLQQIQNLSPSGQNLSSFGYTFDADGQITTWSRQADAANPTVFSLGYDRGNQLLTAILSTNSAAGATLAQYIYGYDQAGNRSSEEIQNGTNNLPSITGATFNNLNQLINLSGTSAPMLFSGGLSKPGTLSVNGFPAFVDPHTTNFIGYTTVSPGTNVVPLVAADFYANTRTNHYQIIVTNNSVQETLTYDLNGNLVSSVTPSLTNTYEWDAADRLTAINSGTNRSEFNYDGLGRRVQILEKQNGTPVTTNKFLWCQLELCEQRDWTGTNLSKRFFAQGEQISGINYFFTRDHLGSVREMTDFAGTVHARYDYDPYGRRTKASGDLDTDFGFTGHFFHPTSGFYLAAYRCYDASAGRWLSRDPLSEKGGINLYAYCANNPVKSIDPLGLSFIDFLEGAAVALVAGAAVGLVGAALAAVAPEIAGGLAVVAVVGAIVGTAAGIQQGLELYQQGDIAGGDFAMGALFGGSLLALTSPKMFSDRPPQSVNQCPANAAPRLVNAQTIQAALEGSEMRTAQADVSIPAVERYVRMLESGSTPPPIKVDDGVIVDGNHRYVAGRVFGVEPPIIPGTLSPSQAGQVRPIQQLNLDPADFGNH